MKNSRPHPLKNPDATDGTHLVPNLLSHNLRLVFCGSRPSRVSAEKKCYYGFPGNKFWPTLHAVGITPRRFAPHEYALLSELEIGLTDLGKDSCGPDQGWKPTIEDIARFRSDIETFQPKILAFTSKNSGQWFLGRKVSYGRQPETIGRTVVFVLPSTSGLNGHWDDRYWHELGSYLHSTNSE